MKASKYDKSIKRKNRLSESQAVFNSAVQKRKMMPVTVRGVQLAKTITIIPPKDFDKLNIDETYQRLKITDEINTLVTVLKSGGQVPDPIDVAQRPDKTWWILDGQQRYWAHHETGTPLRALIHHVEDMDAEKQLFLVLNARRAVQARVMIKSWPGASGTLMHRLNADAKSPLFNLIDFGGNTNWPLDAPTLIRAFLALTTGMASGGNMSTQLLPRLDAELKKTGMIAWCEDFARLIAAVFDMSKGKGRVRILPVTALARVARRKYIEAGRPIFPSSCGALHRANWDSMVPTHAHRYLPVLETEIEKRWK